MDSLLRLGWRDTVKSWIRLDKRRSGRESGADEGRWKLGRWLTSLDRSGGFSRGPEHSDPNGPFCRESLPYPARSRVLVITAHPEVPRN